MNNNHLFLWALFSFVCINAEFLQIPGAVDLSFGPSGSGFTLLDLEGTDVANAMVRDSQGRILLAGQGGAGEDFAVARFSPDGILDLSFGPNGTGFTLLKLGTTDSANAIVLDSQGRILLGGQSGPGGIPDFAVARFTPDGIVDLSFGPSGSGFTLLNLEGTEDIANAMVLDSQDRILLGGQGGAGEDFAVARFTPDGIVDLSFGPSGSGFTLLKLGGTDSANAMVLDSQGRILLGGQSNTAGKTDFAVARFSPDGILDLSFGPNGTGFTLLDLEGTADRANAMVLDSQGRILLGGLSNSAGTFDFAVARFSPDGILDLSFGPSGTGFTLLNLGTSDIANAMVLDSQGRILLGGQSGPAGIFAFAVARFSPDGIVDLSFGSSGSGFTLLNLGGIDIANAMVLDSQGRILLGGVSNESGTFDFAVARFFGEQFTPCTLAIREKYCFLP